MTRWLLLGIAVLLLSACAETDPYKRLKPAPAPALSAKQAGTAFVGRWPRQFKCVQTVTLDFRITTRTLVGYLIVQQPNKFRLQGMSEQGLKLFDIAYADGQVKKIFAAEEFDRKIIDNIARDIRRVFLSNFHMTGGIWVYPPPNEPAKFIDAPSATFNAGPEGTRVTFDAKYSETKVCLVGNPPRVDSYDYRQAGRSLFRIDQYEWKDFDGFFAPSKIVLRERGVQSQGPPYKLTIDISELKPRSEPWPGRVFEAKEDG